MVREQRLGKFDQYADGYCRQQCGNPCALGIDDGFFEAKEKDDHQHAISERVVDFIRRQEGGGRCRTQPGTQAQEKQRQQIHSQHRIPEPLAASRLPDLVQVRNVGMIHARNLAVMTMLFHKP